MELGAPWSGMKGSILALLVILADEANDPLLLRSYVSIDE